MMTIEVRHSTTESFNARHVIPRALVVNDDRAVQHLVRHALERNGRQVDLASDEATMRAAIDSAPQVEHVVKHFSNRFCSRSL